MSAAPRNPAKALRECEENIERVYRALDARDWANDPDRAIAVIGQLAELTGRLHKLSEALKEPTALRLVAGDEG